MSLSMWEEVLVIVDMELDIVSLGLGVCVKCVTSFTTLKTNW
jgi:hypothetical protein